MRIAKFAFMVFFAVALLTPHAMPAQTLSPGDEAQKNADQARAALDAMVKALGGQAWLDIKNQVLQEHLAAFFHGSPDLGTEEIFDFHQWPDHDRIEVTKHRDVSEFFLGRDGWEVTYRGKKPLEKDILDDFLLRRDHSIERAVKVWLRNPKTILVYEGQRMAERHLAEQVTLISPENDSVTILLDIQTHLPLQRIFEWRDPTYHDKNTDTEEYDDYHTIDGFPTPFTITRLKNGETQRQYYVTHVTYNQNLPADFWNPDVA
ncbi:MAG: hypothetical protein ACRD3S_07925, partial [Terracidiphilus sp.]